MRVALVVAALVLARVVAASSMPSFDYLYLEANEGGSSGGHVAIRFGHATTIGSRVPPRWLAICLPNWNGVFNACAHAAAKWGAVCTPPRSSMPP